MWLGDPIDIEVQRNAVAPLGFQLLDQLSEEPIDISFFDIQCKVRRAAGDNDAAVLSPSVTIFDGPNGEFDIVFDGRALSNVTGTMEKVSLAYDVRAIDEVNEPVILMRGTFYLLPGATY